MNYAEKTFRSRDGLQLSYREYAGDAQKTPVLCLHGLTRTCRDFEQLAARIAPSRVVLTPDLRGRGRSQRDPNWLNYHPGVYVEDVWTLLRVAGLERVIVIGTSLGGLIGILMAAMQPAALVGVVLNDIGPELDPRGVERIREHAGRLPAVSDWDAATAEVKRLFGAAFPDYNEAQWLQFARRTYALDEHGAPQLAADPRIGDAARALSPPPGAVQAMWLAFGGLHAIPTLAIRGELSDVLAAEVFARMQREHPRLLGLTAPNRGHPPQLDEAPCVDAIDHFLASLS